MSLLAGKRILITRPEQQGDSLRALLLAQGALPLAFPTIVIVPDPAQIARLDDALQSIDSYDWLIFTSRNAVAFFMARFENSSIPLTKLQKVKVAAVGPATARAIQEHGVSVQLVPDEYVGEAIARSLGNVHGQRVLLPRAQAARETLIKDLADSGAFVDEIPLYHIITNRPNPTAWQELEKGIDYVIFTSASTVRGFFDLLGDRAAALLAHSITACIGPITAKALEEQDIQAQIVPEQYTSEGLVQSMLEFANKKEQEGNR